MQAFVTAERWLGPKSHPFHRPGGGHTPAEAGLQVSGDCDRGKAPLGTFPEECSRAWTRNAMIVDSPGALLASSR